MAYKAFFDEIRTFGVEIECYGVDKTRLCGNIISHGIPCYILDTNDVLPYWRLSSDSSIIGVEAVEVVSPPLSGIEGLEAVGRIMGILSTLGCKVNTSCGFHVHWNIGDFTGKNVQALLRLYAKFEPVIDYLVSPSRRGDTNEHCRSLVKDTTLGWVDRLDPSERKRAAEVAINFERQYSQYHYETRRPRGGRYHKVNVAAYNRYGTAEFRQHQGTVMRSKAINWIVFTQQFVNKAKMGSVSKEPSAKVTLGELLRSLNIDSQSPDAAIAALSYWLKKRYLEFKRAEYGEDVEMKDSEAELAVFSGYIASA